MRRSAILGLPALGVAVLAATNLTAASATTLELTGDATGHTTLLWQSSVPAPAPQYGLTVSKTGTGTVTSLPSGIACGSTCSAAFDRGASVTLTADPTPSAWDAACDSTTETCTIEMTDNTTVTVAFP